MGVEAGVSPSRRRTSSRVSASQLVLDHGAHASRDLGRKRRDLFDRRLRLFIDHPGGVDLALCERVTAHLRDLLVDYGLEVSSPGPERPLTKPDHFRRFVGAGRGTADFLPRNERGARSRLSRAGDG